jgi:hypothetical protein
MLNVGVVGALGAGWIDNIWSSPIPGARPLDPGRGASIASKFPGLGAQGDWYEVRTDSGEVRHVVLPDHSTVLVRGASRFRFHGDSLAVMPGEVDGEIVLDIPEGRSWQIVAGAGPMALSPGRYAISHPIAGTLWLTVAYGRASWLDDTISVDRAGLFGEYTIFGPMNLVASEAPARFPKWWGWERESSAFRDSVEAASMEMVSSSEPGESEHYASKRTCRTATGSIQADGGLTRFNAERFRHLGRCPESAGELIAAAWEGVGEDRKGLRALADASRTIRDGRIEGVLFRLVADTTTPSLVRQTALASLASYVDPSLLAVLPGDGQMTGIQPGRVLAPESDEARQRALPRDRAPASTQVRLIEMNDTTRFDGPVPLQAGIRERVLDMLGGLRSREPRSDIGRLADEILKNLSRT